MSDPFGAESFDDPIGVWSRLVGHHDDATDMAVDADEDERLARAVASQDGGGGDLSFRDSGPAHERAAADRHPVAIDSPLDALAGLLVNIAGRAGLEP